MKKIDVGQTLSILANLGVIIGIVFLAIEIRNTTTQTGTAALQENVARVVEWHRQIATDEATAEVYTSGLADFSDLSKVEQARFDALMRDFLLSVAMAIAVRDTVLVGVGAYEPPPFEERALEGQLLQHLEQPGFRQWWLTADLRGVPSDILQLLEALDSMEGGEK